MLRFKRLVFPAVLVAALIVGGLWAVPGHAAVTDFQLQSLDCASSPGHIRITNTSTSQVSLDLLGVNITPSGGGSRPFNVNAALAGLGTTNNYQVPGGGVLDLQVGTAAAPNPPLPSSTTGQLGATQSVSLTTATQLQPGALVELGSVDQN
ncbi:MAG: hypothetical protein ACYDCQ_23155, partial [Dehalococcoidia bacterium]